MIIYIQKVNQPADNLNIIFRKSREIKKIKKIFKKGLTNPKKYDIINT